MKLKYAQQIDYILKINKDKTPDDWWFVNNQIPLLYKRKDYFSYRDEKEMIADTITLEVNPGGVQQKMPINLLVVAGTGYGKTRVMKTIIKHCHRAGYKIIIIEPKSFEFVNMRFMGNGRRIPPEDKNEKLTNISLYSPFFVKDFLEQRMPDKLSAIKFYSPDVSSLNYADLWVGMGVPAKAAALIVGEIKKRNYNIDKWINMLKYHQELHTLTKNAAISALEALQATGFFNSHIKDLDLKKEWDKNNVVIVGYHNQRCGNLLFDVGLLLNKIMTIGQEESTQGLDKVSKKLIVLDDAFFFAGKEASDFNRTTNTNLAAINISHMQNNARTWGCNTIICVQNLHFNNIYSNLVDGCTSKLIGSTENPEYLRGKIPEAAFNLICNTSPENGPILYTYEPLHLHQWIFSETRTSFETGIAFDCTLGHSN